MTRRHKARVSPRSLAEVRRARGWTQRELAAQLGVCSTTVSVWERRGLPATRLTQVAELLGVDSAELLAGQPRAPRSQPRASWVPAGQLAHARMERDALRRAYEELSEDLNATIVVLADALEFYADYGSYMLADESRLRLHRGGYRRAILEDGGLRARQALGEDL
ncbi:hypothetical protein DL240_09245 [Lujinxingia litoralis]|uniref:HTH cro/C1-type domain-containing protein n=1 Tax=Lujinxingia litoralis TaxID=2211119 RepID=A0A328C631_9DELT|nr:helix-turn-helix transcriptional regulator [Lujinxingia litoralis]RAL23061.1 hypothetical protein DL240_09245 [Lujinxingia litoralis]